MGQKLKFDLGVCFLWNNVLLLNSEIGQVCLILSGFPIVSTMTEDNKRNGLLSNTKKQQQQEYLTRYSQSWSIFYMVHFK
jgi:hypothetical protein